MTCPPVMKTRLVKLGHVNYFTLTHSDRRQTASKSYKKNGTILKGCTARVIPLVNSGIDQEEWRQDGCFKIELPASKYFGATICKCSTENCNDSEQTYSNRTIPIGISTVPIGIPTVPNDSTNINNTKRSRYSVFMIELVILAGFKSYFM